MTLPQRPAGRKLHVAALATALWVFAAPTPAQDGVAGAELHQALFSCGTDPASDRGFLLLEAVPQNDGSWTDLRFVRTADGTGVEIDRFDPASDAARMAFRFSHSTGAEGYFVSIRWDDAAGRQFRLHSLDIPPDPADEDDAGGGSAGLAISSRNGLVEHFACVERPYMFIAYLRQAMSCDLKSAYGTEACKDSPVERSEPLDLMDVDF